MIQVKQTFSFRSININWTGLYFKINSLVTTNLRYNPSVRGAGQLKDNNLCLLVLIGCFFFFS